MVIQNIKLCHSLAWAAKDNSIYLLPFVLKYYLPARNLSGVSVLFFKPHLASFIFCKLSLLFFFLTPPPFSPLPMNGHFIESKLVLFRSEMDFSIQRLSQSPKLLWDPKLSLSVAHPPPTSLSHKVCSGWVAKITEGFDSLPVHRACLLVAFSFQDYRNND